MNGEKHFAEAKRLVAFSPFAHLRRGPGVRQEIKQTKSSFLFLAIIPVGKKSGVEGRKGLQFELAGMGLKKADDSFYSPDVGEFSLL